MKQNLTRLDRAVRLLIGLPTSASYTYLLHDYPKTSYTLLAMGLGLVATGLIGYSPFYRWQRYRRRKLVIVRGEVAADAPAVREINEKAFKGSTEADLVDALRAAGQVVCSLVAVLDEKLVGHILFSPVTVEGTPPETAGVGLAPIAVYPVYRRSGIGAALIKEGLRVCRDRGISWVVVLGSPAYYKRFGFVPALQFGLRCTYDAPSEAFMAIELDPGTLQRVEGLVRYAPQFPSK